MEENLSREDFVIEEEIERTKQGKNVSNSNTNSLDVHSPTVPISKTIHYYDNDFSFEEHVAMITNGTFCSQKKEGDGNSFDAKVGNIINQNGCLASSSSSTTTTTTEIFQDEKLLRKLQNKKKRKEGDFGESIDLILEQEATKDIDQQGQWWEEFYSKHNKGVFFKARNYLLSEFPELMLFANEKDGGKDSILSTSKPFGLTQMSNNKDTTKEVVCKQNLLHILEFGCGYGCSIIPILSANDNAIIFGVDLSETAIQLLYMNSVFQQNSDRCLGFVDDVSTKVDDPVTLISTLALADSTTSTKTSVVEDQKATNRSLTPEEYYFHAYPHPNIDKFLSRLNQSSYTPINTTFSSQQYNLPVDQVLMTFFLSAVHPRDHLLVIQKAHQYLTKQINIEIPTAQAQQFAPQHHYEEERWDEVNEKEHGPSSNDNDQQTKENEKRKEKGKEEGLEVKRNAQESQDESLKKQKYLLFRDYGIYDLSMLRNSKQIDPQNFEYLYKREDGTLAYFFDKDYLEFLLTKSTSKPLFEIHELHYCCVKNFNRKKKTEMRRVFLHCKASPM